MAGSSAVKLFEGSDGFASAASLVATAAALLSLAGATACFAMRGWFHQLAMESFAGEERRAAPGATEGAPPRPEGASTDLMVGGLTLMLGLGITAASVAAASGGGRYVVTTALIVYGLFRLGRGLRRLGK